MKCTFNLEKKTILFWNDILYRLWHHIIHPTRTYLPILLQELRPIKTFPKPWGVRAPVTTSKCQSDPSVVRKCKEKSHNSCTNKIMFLACLVCVFCVSPLAMRWSVSWSRYHHQRRSRYLPNIGTYLPCWRPRKKERKGRKEGRKEGIKEGSFCG